MTLLEAVALVVASLVILAGACWMMEGIGKL